MLIAPPRACRASHLKEIRKVRAKAELDAHAVGLAVEIAQRKALEAGGVPKEAGTPDVDEVVLERESPLCIVEIGIGEVAGEPRVVLADRRTQQQRPRAADREMKM